MHSYFMPLITKLIVFSSRSTKLIFIESLYIEFNQKWRLCNFPYIKKMNYTPSDTTFLELFLINLFGGRESVGKKRMVLLISNIENIVDAHSIYKYPPNNNWIKQKV